LLFSNKSLKYPKSSLDFINYFINNNNVLNFHYLAGESKKINKIYQLKKFKIKFNKKVREPYLLN
jgi:hypothetical protein